MRETSLTSRRIGDVVLLILHVFHKFSHAVDRHVLVNDENEWIGGDIADHREVLQRIVLHLHHLPAQLGQNRMRRQEQRVSIRLGARNEIGRQSTAGSATCFRPRIAVRVPRSVSAQPCAQCRPCCRQQRTAQQPSPAFVASFAQKRLLRTTLLKALRSMPEPFVVSSSFHPSRRSQQSRHQTKQATYHTSLQCGAALKS